MSDFSSTFLRSYFCLIHSKADHSIRTAKAHATVLKLFKRGKRLVETVLLLSVLQSIGFNTVDRFRRLGAKVTLQEEVGNAQFSPLISGRL